MLLLAALGIVVLLLAADRSLVSGWPHWPAVFPLLALALIVFIANAVYARLRPLGWLIPTAAFVAAILLIIDLPKALDHAKAVPLGGWVRLAAAVLLAVLLAKLLLLHRHASRGHTRVADDPPPLLPSQEKDLAELDRLINDQRLGRVLPLEGRLGEGKSFLVQRLKHQWDDDRSKPVVVVVDVWQQETESDLQRAILEALFIHPAYLARLGWLHVPVSFLFARWIAAARKLTSTIELKFRENKAGLALDFDIPGLRWQSHFERVTARMAGRGTVVVLDEIDRATPLVAQAALTLARRSVDVPGVTVLIPYIRSLIRYKAFNPLQPVLKDLGSSMDAILYEERFALRSSGALFGDPADTILKACQDLPKWPPADQEGSPDGKPPDDLLTQALRVGVFANAAGPFRERLQERFEEKYLGPAGVKLHPPQPDDLAAMVAGFPSLSREAHSLISQQDGWAETIGLIMKGLEKWLNGHPELTGPPLRVLEGWLYRTLQEAVRVAGRGQLRPADVAALAIAAYDGAGLIHGPARREP